MRIGARRGLPWRAVWWWAAARRERGERLMHGVNAA